MACVRMLNNKVAAEAPASSGRGDHCRRAALSLTACLRFDCNAIKFNSVSAEANGPAEAPPRGRYRNQASGNVTFSVTKVRIHCLLSSFSEDSGF